jgi:hypothetical protein
VGIRVTELSELDSDLVNQEDELLAEMLQEDNPSINAKQGVFRDYLGHYGGVLGAKNQTEADRLRRSQSLREVQLDPGLADEDTVDNIASNYRVTRRAGTTAGGDVTMIVDTLAAMTVATGTVFEAQGKQFQTTQPFTARTTSADVVAANDRLLTPIGDGTYSFQITVEALEDGSNGNLPKDTLFAVTPLPLNYVKSFASEDFIGGSDTESNQDLVDRFIEGMSAKAFSGRENMVAALKEQEDFNNVVADSIIGLGDQEMLRDQHTIFPGSMGGRVDWYIRTQPLYRRYGVAKSAVLIEQTSDGFGIWQMSFGRDEYPGLYDVFVQPSDDSSYTGSFEITEYIRAADMTELEDGDGFLPDIVSALEATYSRFQSVVVRFKDDRTPSGSLTVGSSSADYNVTVRAMPLIAEIQEYALRRRVRNVMGDLLVKAPVPCFLSLTFNIELRPGQAAPDTDEIAESLANLVNYYGFAGRLPASALSDAVHNYLEAGTGLSAIDMFGKILKPSGDVRFIRSTEVLEVPDEPAEMSTRRTVVFLLDPADVSISVLTADVLEI